MAHWIVRAIVIGVAVSLTHQVPPVSANSFGQVGDQTKTDRWTPVDVLEIFTGILWYVRARVVENTSSEASSWSTRFRYRVK